MHASQIKRKKEKRQLEIDKEGEKKGWGGKWVLVVALIAKRKSGEGGGP